MAERSPAAGRSGSVLGSDDTPEAYTATGTPAAPEQRRAAAPGRLARLRRLVGEIVDRFFGAATTAVVLAVFSTVVGLQFFSLGYLLLAAKRLAETGRLRDGFIGVREASRIGQLAVGAWLWLLPWRLLTSLASDAALVAPGSAQVNSLRRGGWLALALAVLITVVAALQGGELRHFLRPLRALRSLHAQSRRPGFWDERRERLRRFVRAFRVGEVLSLGFRGYLGAFLWLAVPTTVIAAGREGPLVVVGAVALVAVLQYLPFLQIHFAVEGKLRAMLEVKTVRYLFPRAPVAFCLALLSTSALALPLYLLKVELVPRDALWLPAVVFVVTIFPTKLATAWAYHRALQRQEPRHWIVRGPAKLLMVVGASGYAFAVFLTQYTGWHGVLGLYEHHAYLLPVPF